MLGLFSIFQGILTLAANDEDTPKETRTTLAILDFVTGILAISLGVLLLAGIHKVRTHSWRSGLNFSQTIFTFSQIIIFIIQCVWVSGGFTGWLDIATDVQ